MSVLAACLALSACGGKIADNTEHFDDITKTLKLSKTYEGKKLMSNDGIEEATLIGDTTDGDTSNFSLKGGGSVTVRYQGVDTPESTAGVEKWGKAASQFTNERLHAATTIVIESASGKTPDKDSVGQRSLCYVWYKTETDDFKCLNLELVENGYSYNKESASNGYYSYFQEAEKFARKIKLRLFSELDDPLFNTDITEFSIKDFLANPDGYTENMKVRLMAYVSDRKVSSTNSVTLMVAQYDTETNKAYEIQLFAGYADASAASMSVGNLYQIVGTLQKHDGRWQISGITLDNDEKGNTQSEKTWIAQRRYWIGFDSSTMSSIGSTSNAYSEVTVSSAELSGTTLTIKGTALWLDEDDGDPVNFTFTVTVPETYDGAIKEGSKLSIKDCYQFKEGSGEITISDYSKITVKQNQD